MAELIEQISIMSAILAYLCHLIYRLKFNKPIILNDVIMVSLSGAMLPFAIIITLLPFLPELNISIDNISRYLAITGLILILVYVKSIIDRTK